jgi:pimeloyl-ACP methyl ester carboxylesterase
VHGKCDDSDGSYDSNTWSPAERAEVNLEVVSLDSYGVPVSLELPLDPDEPEAGTFQQFYFMANEHDPAKPTVLYVPGSGAVIHPAGGPLNFLASTTNVVYFHVRGSGLSQIPASNEFDRYLRLRYVLRDLEAIRKELGIERWDAIFAQSAGTMVAQRYAAAHPEHVAKIALTGAPSKHESDSVIRPQKHGEIVRNVINFTLGDDSDLAPLRAHPDKVDMIADKVVEAVETLHDVGLSEAYIVTQKLHDRPDFDELLEAFPFLRYPPEFFVALGDLAHYGWRDTAGPVRLISLLAHEVLVAEGDPAAELVETESLTFAQDHYEPIVQAMQAGNSPQPRFSARTSYVFGAYDGLNTSVLEAVEAADGDVPAAFEAIKNANPLIPTVRNKIGVVDEPIRPWDPAEYPYTTPLLLLQGNADTFTFPYQAEHIYDQAARGPAVKVLLAGVGHGFFIPKETLKFPLFRAFVTDTMSEFAEEHVLDLLGEFSATDRAAPIAADEAIDIRTE